MIKGPLVVAKSFESAPDEVRSALELPEEAEREKSWVRTRSVPTRISSLSAKMAMASKKDSGDDEPVSNAWIKLSAASWEVRLTSFSAKAGRTFTKSRPAVTSLALDLDAEFVSGKHVWLNPGWNGSSWETSSANTLVCLFINLVKSSRILLRMYACFSSEGEGFSTWPLLRRIGLAEGLEPNFFLASSLARATTSFSLSKVNYTSKSRSVRVRSVAYFWPSSPASA